MTRASRACSSPGCRSAAQPPLAGHRRRDCSCCIRSTRGRGGGGVRGRARDPLRDWDPGSAAGGDPGADADGLLAALASTLDTHLNWGASYWSRDIYQASSARHGCGASRGVASWCWSRGCPDLLILAIALVIMANLGSIQTAWFLSLLFGAGMGSVLVLRWLWERINLWSELAAMATSLSWRPMLLLTTDTEWIRLAVMAHRCYSSDARH
jgi:hypothetical protein